VLEPPLFFLDHLQMMSAQVDLSKEESQELPLACSKSYLKLLQFEALKLELVLLFIQQLEFSEAFPEKGRLCFKIFECHKRELALTLAPMLNPSAE